MTFSVTMPQLGESVTEGTVTRWLKQVGDTVAADEPLLEVSTDKVDTEIPSPTAGVLLAIRAQEDETVLVGAELAVIGAAGDAPAPAATAAPVAPPAPTQTPNSAQGTAEISITLPALGESVTEGTVTRWLKQVGDQVTADEPILEISTDKVDTEIPAPASGTLVAITAGEDQTVAVGSELGRIATGASASVASAPVAVAPVAVAVAPVAVAPVEVADLSDAYVTPLVRRLAAQNNIDLATVTGTGVGGRIRKQDVLDAAQQKDATGAVEAATPVTAATPPASPLRGRTEKMPRLRKVIAERLVESLQTSAQLTTVIEVDVSLIASLRNRVKNEFEAREGVKLTFLPFFCKAAVEALKQYPQVNASIDMAEGTITYHDSENLGIAVDTERGLLVPVIQRAGDLNIAGLARHIADVAERTRTNKVSPDELSGGTFTVTNTGSRGALFDTPIINLPQVAILGTGAVVKRPIVVTDATGQDVIAIRSMVYLALSYDHRIIDGADAARFLGTMRQRLEEASFEADLGL
ncbi:MAG: 2-oxoglutarate dehydrogenase, E2 component, dihydrolipoamide succinyltransferase [Actinobacteria bacterium]|nr:2-oxoglutarate dehydrogenase, E2 component, dihydrolipoamide succinyltransferase [Actinomycetota bacterium]